LYSSLFLCSVCHESSKGQKIPSPLRLVKAQEIFQATHESTSKRESEAEQKSRATKQKH